MVNVPTSVYAIASFIFANARNIICVVMQRNVMSLLMTLRLVRKINNAGNQTTFIRNVSNKINSKQNNIIL